MAFTSTGRDIAVKVNPLTGKLRRVWDTSGPNKGNPRFDDSEEHAVYVSVFCRRGAWWADSTGTFGSLMYTLFGDAKATPAKFVSYAQDALDPLVVAGRIADPKAYATRSFDRMDGLVTYRTPDGKPQEVRPSLPIT